jgi:CDP-diacylglycerol--glycerol-3-phosphate 3-phosphatidyltransferase
MYLNVPNMLTLLRIALIPMLGLAFLLPQPTANWLAVAIFGLAGITDWFDGYLARRLGQTSAFGAFLDPVADKLIVAVALVALLTFNPEPAFAVPAAIIIGREIAVSALREWMAALGQRASVAVNMMGKVKTSAQMIAITLLLFGRDLFGLPLQQTGLWLLYIAAILTLHSAFLYLRAAWSVLRQESVPTRPGQDMGA